MCMRETSLYLKLNLATLCQKEIGSFDVSMNGSFTYCHNITGLLKNIVLSPIYAN